VPFSGISYLSEIKTFLEMSALRSFFTGCILLFPILIRSQVVQNTIWQNTIGSYQEDVLSGSLRLPDGRILVYGSSNSSLGYDKSEPAITYGYDDYWIVMMDSAGNKLWDAVYGGDADDKMTSAVLLPDGGFLLAGMSRSGAGYDRTEAALGSGDDYWVLRIDSTGAILWDNAYGGTEWDQLYQIILTEDNGFLLIGWSRSYSGFDKSEDPIGAEWTRDYWIVKLDSSGVPVWENTIGGNSYDEAYDGIQTTDGGYLILGTSNSNASGDKTVSQHGLPGIPTDDYWLVKLDENGNVVWDKTIGGTGNDVPFGMLDCGDETYLLYGYSYSSPGFEKSEAHIGYGDYWLVKVDASGYVLWDKTIGANQSDRATCAVRIHDDYYLIGGTSWSEANNDKTEPSNGQSDFWIVGVDGTGQVQWDDAIGCDEEEELQLMELMENGNILLAGSSISDTCADKSEMNKGGADNAEDYFLLERKAYAFYVITESIYACIDSSYILPWGQVVDTYGVYFDTIPGEFLDTLYTVSLMEIILNDTILAEPGYIYVVDCAPATYTWINCDTWDTVFSGESVCWFDVYEDGNYAVIVESGDCSVTSDCVFAEGWGVLQSEVNKDFILFPNPGDGSINLNTANEIIDIRIFDLLGRAVQYYWDPIASPGRLSITSAPPGIYTIFATAHNGSSIVQYVKNE